jgi:RHS repeat-associated protein
MSGYGFTNAGTTYDDEDRLTGYQRTNGALSQSWNLTSVGDWNSVTTNGTAQSRTHGPTHELLTAGGQTVNTDVKGNITLLPAALSSLASTALGMAWDFDNKLKSVDVGNNSSTDVEYKYDALGRRVARVGSSGSFVYVQSDQQTIADYGVGDAPSSPLYRYVYASYIDEPVVRKGAGTGGTIHYFHRNQQYSITAVTTSAGTIAERYAYSAYGEPTILDGSGSQISTSSINNRYSYTGREWDATVGLYHFRARWMSPMSGRFLGRDPIGYKGSPYDLYEYLDGQSLFAVDPSGLGTTPIAPLVPTTNPPGGKGQQQHHFFPRKHESAINKLCQKLGFVIHDYTILVQGSVATYSEHWYFQYGPCGNWNNDVSNTIASSSNCCDLMKKMMDLIEERMRCVAREMGTPPRPIQTQPWHNPFANNNWPGTQQMIDAACKPPCPKPFPITVPVPAPAPAPAPGPQVIPTNPGPWMPPFLVPPRIPSWAPGNWTIPSFQIPKPSLPSFGTPVFPLFLLEVQGTPGFS